MSLVDLKDPRPEKKNERRTIWPDLPYFFLILFSPTCLLVRITFICENGFSLYLFLSLSLIYLVKFFSQGPLITHLDAGRRNRAKVGGGKEWKKKKREKAEHVRSTYVSKSLYGIGRKATLMPLFRSSTVLKLRPFVINTINLPLDTRLSKLGPDISWIEGRNLPALFDLKLETVVRGNGSSFPIQS